jgi:excisionase family DNA binding protein
VSAGSQPSRPSPAQTTHLPANSITPGHDHRGDARLAQSATAVTAEPNESSSWNGAPNAGRVMAARSRPASNLATKPLLSIEEAAILLGETRSTLYRAVQAGTLPLPVYTIGGRLRIPRRAVERLLDGDPPLSDKDHQGQAGRDETTETSPRKSRPMCSAARRSSVARPSV